MHVGSENLGVDPKSGQLHTLTGMRLARNRCQRLLTSGKLDERTVPALDLGVRRNWVSGALGKVQPGPDGEICEGGAVANYAVVPLEVIVEHRRELIE